jgi:hypothetical protein
LGAKNFLDFAIRSDIIFSQFIGKSFVLRRAALCEMYTIEYSYRERWRDWPDEARQPGSESGANTSSPERLDDERERMV